MKLLSKLVLFVCCYAVTFTVFAKPDNIIGINTCKELQNVQHDLSYELLQDIDCSGISFYPIGSEDSPFEGFLDGNHHIIRNLAIYLPSHEDVGLFGFIRDAHLTNLNIDGSIVSGKSSVGIIAGTIFRSTITNVGVTSSEVEGESSVGLLFGYSSQSNITKAEAQGNVLGGRDGAYAIGGVIGDVSASDLYDIHADVDVYAPYAKYVGGVVGRLDDYGYYNTAKEMSASGEVTGSMDVGGLVGHASAEISDGYATGAVYGINGENIGGLVGTNHGQIVYSYSSATVQGQSNVGGLVGQSSLDPYADRSCSVENSYSISSVEGNTSVGGLIGEAVTCDVINTYSAGKVQGQANVGGLIGNSDARLDPNNNYWDTETSGQDQSSGGSGRTTDQMYQRNNYIGWDFYGVWQINEGKSYPLLQAWYERN